MLQKELAEMKGSRAQKCDVLKDWKPHCNWIANCEKYKKAVDNKCPQIQRIQMTQGKDQIWCVATQWEETNRERRQF